MLGLREMLLLVYCEHLVAELVFCVSWAGLVTDFVDRR